MNEPEMQITAHDQDISLANPGGDSEPSTGVVQRQGLDRLFLEYYGLIEQPFGVTPDPRFLYLGAKHRQALDVLNYGTELNRGFLTLIAKPGMGKTSLLLQYLEGLRDKARTVFLFQTDADSTELMRYLLAELGLGCKGMDLPEMRAVLSQVLLGEMEAGRRFILVIDEAQNLDEKVLESIRLLSNFETPWMKLMHIVLAGQPQLDDRLAKPSMAQLRQRVSFAIRIEPFMREEVDHYIDHRLWVAGYKGLPLFSAGARELIAERSEGIPRTINNICFCSMSFAWATKQKTVDRQMMSDVLADLDGRPPSEKKQERGSKSLDEPRPIVSQSVPRRQTVSLTFKPHSARNRLASLVAVAALVVFALGWYGLHFRADRSVGSTFHDFLTTVKSFVVSTPASASSSSRPQVAPNNSSNSLKPDAISNIKDANVPQQAGVDSPSSNPGPN